MYDWDSWAQTKISVPKGLIGGAALSRFDFCAARLGGGSLPSTTLGRERIARGSISVAVGGGRVPKPSVLGGR